MSESGHDLDLKYVSLWVIQIMHSYKLNETIEEILGKNSTVTEVAKIWLSSFTAGELSSFQNI
jgi:hypothetical protein